MIILLAPSKTLDFETKAKISDYTLPQLKSESAKIIEELKKLSPTALKEQLKVSEKLAAENHKRYQQFQLSHTTKNSKQALLSYKGDVYRDIDAQNYSKADWDFAQRHLRILSGLYGILRPLDLIQPYRLEMKGKKQFWQTPLTKQMEKELTEEKSNIILKLTSEEYFAPIQSKKLKAKVISVNFKDRKKNKIIPIYSKIARGTMANWIIKNKIADPADLKNFSEDGYRFEPAKSTETQLTFSR